MHTACCLFVVFAVLAMTSVVTARQEPVSIRVDTTKRHQTIEGFGASGCWTAQLAGDWPTASRERALELLFTDRGAALSIWRYNIGAGGGEEIHDATRRTRGVEVEPGRYDLSRDKAALDVVRGAVERGVLRVVLFANSLPERFTVSGKVSGGENGSPNLKPGSEDEAAAFLVDVTLRIKRELGLRDVRLSPMNEPQWQWGGRSGRRQEGCNMLPDQLAKLTAACARQLQERDPTILLEGPEGGEWKGATFSYIEAFAKEPALMKQLGALAVHSYWSNDDDRRAFMEKYRGAGLAIPLAQTEWCEMKHGRDAGMEGAFTLFRTVHSDLTICGVTNWSFWLAMSHYDYRDGLLYIEPDHSITPAKRLFALGHFSRFVRPGDVRVDATTSVDRLLVTSFLSADGRRIATVMANPTDAAVTIAIEMPGAALPASGTLVVTGEQRDMTESTCAPNAIVVPPNSIATYVCEPAR